MSGLNDKSASPQFAAHKSNHKGSTEHFESRTAQMGTEGIPTSISTLGPERDQLIYRGYSFADLATNVSYEEVIYLLLNGELPSPAQLQAFKSAITQKRHLHPGLIKILELLPKEAHPNDVLRTIVSVIGLIEKEKEDFSNEYECSLRLIGMLGPALIYWYHYSQSGIKIDINPSTEDSIASNFLKILTQQDKIDPDMLRSFEVCLIAVAENSGSSTLSTRINSSTQADFYSCITTAISSIKGVLHGGANEATIRYLKGLKSFSDVDNFLNKMYQNKELIMGFGHPAYKKSGDPRRHLLAEWAKITSLKKNSNLFDIADYLARRLKDEKGLLPNVDFYMSVVLHNCGIPEKLLTCISSIGRLGGFSAHTFEQRKQKRLLYQLYPYIGPLNKKVHQKL